ncbi:type III pantothenate kinase [Adlercreutzia caecimuris]|uniref:type III pantothenate kinase n=1 Tax=Adlercreutzia caecimuris TaxID=671266 RepID=UPI001C3E335B|nr:type III pantothenate kinase [Adlercreutzia caecimuris]MCR2036492.1 type III pantothenate kinase [Adlercreutzia caecimuris]
MSSLLLLVDIRNSHTRLGLAVDGALHAQWSIGTSAACTADEAISSVVAFYDAIASSLATPLSQQPFDGATLPSVAPLADDAIIASVFPALTEVWVEATRRLTGRRPLTVGPGLKTGLKMGFADPTSVGADRVAEMVAAKRLYGFPTLVIDLGTCTTFELLDEHGCFKGGILAPGMRLGAQALASGTAQLPSVELRAPRSLLGRTTAEAMQSGIVMGEAARIDGIIDLIEAEVDYESTVVLTGDGAESMVALLRHKSTANRTLGLEGLIDLFAMNRK